MPQLYKKASYPSHICFFLHFTGLLSYSKQSKWEKVLFRVFWISLTMNRLILNNVFKRVFISLYDWLMVQFLKNANFQEIIIPCNRRVFSGVRGQTLTVIYLVYGVIVSQNHRSKWSGVIQKHPCVW